MSDTFQDTPKCAVKKVDPIIVFFRAFILYATGVLVTLGLLINGVDAPYLFGIAVTFALMWLRGTKGPVGL